MIQSLATSLRFGGFGTALAVAVSLGACSNDLSKNPAAAGPSSETPGSGSTGSGGAGNGTGGAEQPGGVGGSSSGTGGAGNLTGGAPGSATGGTTGMPSGEASACGVNGYTIRRLTRAEYNNTVRSILNDESSPANSLPADVIDKGFANNVETGGVSLLHVEKYEELARSLVLAASARGFWPTCSDRACASDVLASFGRRAWRRTLAQADLDGLLRLFDAQSAAGASVTEALQTALSAVLLAPDFVFLIDEAGANGMLTAPSLASRLSHFLWSNTPDEELLVAAESGALSDPAAREAQARRLLADSKSSALVDEFATQWLGLYKVLGINPDFGVFGNVSIGVKESMRRESARFFEAFLKEPISALDLWDADFGFMNDELAWHYNMPRPGSQELVRIAADPARGGGLLTHGGILSITSVSNRTSPVVRGEWVLQRVLCEEPPPPPPNIPPLPEGNAGANLTVREKAELHRSNPSCASCHNLMDPIGFGFENYDGVGRWRTEENGKPIDASGELNGQAFNGPAELRQLLKNDPRAVACMTEKVLSYALARSLTPAHDATKQELVGAFAQKSHQLGELLVSTVRSEAFASTCGTRPLP